jgi:hypothetical protein
MLLLHAMPALTTAALPLCPCAFSYISASVYCNAPIGLVAADAKLVQKVLAMVSAAAYIIGLIISWLWTLLR